MDLAVVIPYKEGASVNAEPVPIWPLVEAALDKIEADATTREAAQQALRYSDGCAVLANYLNSEAKRVHRMDYRFKVPLVMLAAQMAREDDMADSIFDPDEGAVYFETDDGQYSFHVFKEWTVDWERAVDYIDPGYEWSGIENQTWALDKLLAFLSLDYTGDA